MGGTLSFGSASWLWLLPAAVAFVVWAAWRTLTNFPPRQRLLQGALRALTLGLVIVALADPACDVRARQVSVVYLVDVSASVATAEITRAAAWIDQAEAAASPDHSAVVVFGRDVSVLPDAAALARLAGARAAAGAPDAGHTNLERALDGVRGAFAPGHLRRVILFSDARPTAGNVTRATARLAADGIEVHTVPLEPRDVGDAWIDEVAGPDRVAAGEPFTIDVVLFSQIARSVVVELHHRGEPIALQALRLEPGLRRLPLDARIHQEGPAVVEAVLRADGDPVSRNNSARHALVVGPRRELLYVEGRPASAYHLRTALEVGGFDVTQMPAARVPATVEALQRFDAVIISDVEASALDERAMAAVEQYVAQGGGLVLAGGESVYGHEGYADTPIERALPVRFEVTEPPGDVALIIAIDRSWSMVGPTLELAKEAAKAAVDVLEDDHLVGIMAFHFDYEWVAPLQPAANREAIKARISSIDPSGHTVIYPAIQEAHRALREVEASVRHLILFSDGRTYEDPYEELVTRMARDEITVSTVAVGSDADREFMTNLSVWGKGRAYAFVDAREVPQIFVTETERIARGALDERPTTVRIHRPAALFNDLPMPSVPRLLGFTRATLKDAGDLLLATPGDDPLLARWHYGLGRAAFFASDVKERWGVEWLRWTGYRVFWTRVVRDVMRRPDPAGGLHVEYTWHPDGRRLVRAVFEAIDRSGEFATLAAPHVSVAGGEGTQAVALVQTAPGRYEADLPIESDRDVIVGAQFEGRPAFAPGTPLARFVLAEDVDELRLRPADLSLLEAISRATGGTFAPAPGSIAAPGETAARAPRALWPWLLWCAVLGFLADLLFRRIRVWEDVGSLDLCQD